MTFFDRNPQWFRIIFGSISGLLLASVLFSFYRLGKAPTDENWFKDPPSNLYITSTIQATREGTGDSLRAGDLLVQINGKMASTQDLAEAIFRTTDTARIPVTVLRLNENKSYRYLVDPVAMTKGAVRPLPPVVYVFEVVQDGASDRAGMKKGDLILRINGKGFTNVTEADNIMRQAQAGKAIDYEVFRDNQTLTLRVTLASFGLPFSFLVIALCGLLYIGMGLFLGLKRPNITAARLLSVFFVMSGFSIAAAFIRPEVSPDLLTRVRNVLSVLGLMFSIPLLIHIGHYFPKEQTHLLSRRWVKRTGYAIVVLFALLMLKYGIGAFLAGVGTLLLYASYLGWRFRKVKDHETKTIMRPVKFTGLAATLLVVLIFTSLFTFEVASPSYLFGYVGFPLLLIPIGYLYVVGQHHLLDLDLRVRRSFQYSVAATLWRLITFIFYLWVLFGLSLWKPSFPAVRLTGGSFEILDTPAPPDQQDLFRYVILVSAVVALTYLMWNVGHRVLRVIARMFHRALYDYRLAAAELGGVMATKLSMSGLARGIVEKLRELMKLKRAGVLFFRNGEICCQQEAHVSGGTTSEEFCFMSGSSIAGALQTFMGPISVDYFPQQIKEEFRKEELHIVIPIRSQERLIGAILVGEKQSEATFQREDFEFLSAAATQAAVAIENAFLYEELAEQERMKHELAIARRIQLESLPQTTPDIEGLELSGVSKPALEVGGDYFDYLNGDSRKCTVVVGDVSGKGTSAALYMSKVQGILRSLHGFGLAPRELFVRANKLLYNDMQKKSFITSIGAMFDTGERSLRLARAGHLPLFYCSAGSQRVERIVPRGIGLGLESGGVFDPELEELKFYYHPRDTFLFVTDGVTEAMTIDGEQFGEQRLEGLLRQVSDYSAKEIQERILAAVAEFTGTAAQHDDQTVVVVKAL